MCIVRKWLWNGSVVATYKDREGNELAQSEAVANVPDGIVPARLKPFRLRLKLQHQKDSLVQSLRNTLAPMNGAGSLKVVRPLSRLMYDKTETVVVNGSVIATYKDIEGNELAPQERNVKTNVPDGLYHYSQDYQV